MSHSLSLSLPLHCPLPVFLLVVYLVSPQASGPQLYSVLGVQNFLIPTNSLQLLFNLREPQLLAQALSSLLLLDKQDSVGSQDLQREVSCAGVHQMVYVGI